MYLYNLFLANLSQARNKTKTIIDLITPHKNTEAESVQNSVLALQGH